MRYAISHILCAAIVAVAVTFYGVDTADARPATVKSLARSHASAERALARCSQASATPSRWATAATREGARAARARTRHVRARSKVGLVRSRNRVRTLTSRCVAAAVHTPAPPAPERDGPPELPRRSVGSDSSQRHDGDLTDRVRNTQTAGALAQKLERLGRSRLGAPYVWGTQGSRRFDCSGLTWWLYDQVGIEFQRTSTYQDWRSGIGPDWTRGTAFAQLLPGDVVYLRPSSAGPQHVGLYIGDGKLLHASSGAKRVILSDITSGYYRENYIGWLRHEAVGGAGTRRS